MPLRNQFETEQEWLDHLRLYFAAAALPAFLSMEGYAGNPQLTSQLAYRIADAMLKEREKGTNNGTA